MLSREVTIEQDVELNQVSFSIYNKVGAHSVIENSSFGRYSYCEPYAMIQKMYASEQPSIPCNALRLIISPTGAECTVFGIRMMKPFSSSAEAS